MKTLKKIDDLKAIEESTDGKWLVEQLRRSLEISVEHIVRTAAIVRRLEELGIEVTIKIAALPFLRKIAHGNMIPELYVALEGDNLLLEKAASLPTPDQEKISRNDPLKVMEINGESRLVPPLSMTRQEIHQVFANGRLRDEAEQVGYLRDRLQKEAARSANKGEELVRVDRKRGGIIIAGAFLSASDLAHYLGELSKPRR